MFSKREEEYLNGSLQLSKNYDKTIRRRINKKIRLLLEQSLPLLAKNPYTNHWLEKMNRVLNTVPRGTEYRTGNECGGWDSNPRTPERQEPRSCAFDLAWQPPHRGLQQTQGPLIFGPLIFVTNSYC